MIGVHVSGHFPPLLLVLLLLLAPMAGCASEVEDTQHNSALSDGTNMTDNVTEDVILIPPFNMTSHDGISYSSHGLIGTSYVLYFSAQWCGHCHPTLTALDNVIPLNRLIIIGKDPRPEYENMSQWKSDTEEALNRTLDRPFCLGPEVAEANGVAGIPFFRMVNETGVIVYERTGLFTDEVEISRQWNLTWFGPSSNDSGEIGS